MLPRITVDELNNNVNRNIDSQDPPFSQKLTQPSKEISYPVGDLCQHFTKLTGSSAYTLHSNLYPQKMVQMAFCDLSHTFHKQVTNVSRHVSVILTWRILKSPLTEFRLVHAGNRCLSSKSLMKMMAHEGATLVPMAVPLIGRYSGYC